MTPLFPEELSARLIDRSPFMAIGDMTPPRDPDEDGDDEDEDEDEEEGDRRRTAGGARAGRRLEHDPASTIVTGRPERGMERTRPSGVDSLPLAPYPQTPSRRKTYHLGWRS